jgi:ASC-1-like (ASCH) protein
MLDLVGTDRIFPGWTRERGIQEWRGFYSPSRERDKGVIGFAVKKRPPPPQLQSPQSEPTQQQQPHSVPQPQQSLIYKVSVEKQVDGTYFFWGRIRDQRYCVPLTIEWLEENRFDRNRRARCYDNPGVFLFDVSILVGDLP